MRKLYKSKITMALMMLITSLTAFAQIPNAGFENWTAGSCLGGIYNYNDPNSWGTLNSSTCLVGDFTTQKTTTPANVHSGSAALELYSQYISFASATAPGICVTGTINTNTDAVVGGFPNATRPDKFIGWYKYAPVAPDTFSLSVNIFSGATSVTIPMGAGSVSGSNPVSTYTKFIANISYNSGLPADSAQITLLCSAGANGQSGTIMYIDDLAFVSCAGFGATPTTVNASCTSATGSITLGAPVNGTAPYNYAWSNGSTASSLSSLVPGTYKVTITDDNTCASVDSIVVSATNAPFTVTATGSTTSCTSNTGTVSVTSSAGNSPYTYLWSTSSTATQITGLGAGNYTVTSTDAHGCTTSASGSVTTPNGPSATETSTNIACHNDSTGTITVSVTGGASPINYVWSNTATTVNLTHVAAGTYTLTITDNNNCSFEVSATITAPTALSIIGNNATVSCFGDSTGALSVSTTGGTSPYTYSWNTGAGTSAISSLPAGTYVVVVVDSNLCTDSSSLSITQPTAVTVSLTATNASSITGSDGTDIAVASGGTGTLTLAWSTGSSHDTIAHLSPATYCITVTDINNCSATACDSVGFTADTSTIGIKAITTVQIKIYPNPANNQLTIETNATNGKFIFSIYSLDGRMVEQKTITGDKSNLQLNQFADGFYTYQLRDVVSGATNYGKLEIQR